MKYIKNILLGSVLFGMTGLTSCLKDTYIPPSDPSGGSPSVVGFLSTGDPTTSLASTSAIYTQNNFTYDPFPDTVGFNLNVAYLGQGYAPEDVVVNIGVDAAALTAYNTALGLTGANSYVTPPAAVYILPASITIPKGKYSATGRIIIKNGPAFDYSKKYAIPAAITSASTSGIGISSNMGKAIFSFGIKNPYDGIYTVVSGTVQRYSDPTTPTTGDALNGDLASGTNITVATSGANAVTITGLQWAKAGGAVGGIDGLTATVNTTTNAVTMSSPTATNLANWSGKVNKYDPATKTFTLNFDWNQTSTKREYSVILKYSKSR